MLKGVAGPSSEKIEKIGGLTAAPPGQLVREDVLTREVNGWQSFFRTAAEATVARIPEAFADRTAIEQDFHDLQEVQGAGRQQVRH